MKANILYKDGHKEVLTVAADPSELIEVLGIIEESYAFDKAAYISIPQMEGITIIRVSETKRISFSY